MNDECCCPKNCCADEKGNDMTDSYAAKPEKPGKTPKTKKNELLKYEGNLTAVLKDPEGTVVIGVTVDGSQKRTGKPGTTPLIGAVTFVVDEKTGVELVDDAGIETEGTRADLEGLVGSPVKVNARVLGTNRVAKSVSEHAPEEG